MMRTISKNGLEGLRLGMIFGRSEWPVSFTLLMLLTNLVVLILVVAGPLINNLQFVVDVAFLSQSDLLIGKLLHRDLVQCVECLRAIT